MMSQAQGTGWAMMQLWPICNRGKINQDLHHFHHHYPFWHCRQRHQVICPGRGDRGGLPVQQLRTRSRRSFDSKHRCCQLRHMKSKRREGDHLDWKQQNVAICTLPGSPTHFQVSRGTWLIYTSLFKRHSFKCIVKLAGTKKCFFGF